ncbi:MAG: cysteine hydrolase family protein [Thermoplasmata archaeon]
MDMINDFVTGKMGSERIEAIVPTLRDFLEVAGEKDILKVFVQDRHREDDPEITHWGPHAMEYDEASETIPELDGMANRKLPKRFYDAFYKTDLELTLKQHQIDRVLLTGVTTDVCVQNTAAGAFYRDYDIKVVEDCTEAQTEKKKKSALEYMKEVFGAEIVTSEEVIKRW